MYANITGVWIAASSPPNSLAPSRTAVPIEWPRGEDGVIVLDLVDTDRQPVALALGTGDSISFLLGFDDVTGALITIAGAAVAGDPPGRYTFALPGSQLTGYRGKLLYSVVAKKGGQTQQVVPPAYFTSTLSLVS